MRLVNPTSSRSIVVIGSSGQLGRAMTSYFGRTSTVLPFDRTRLDLEDLAAIGPALEGLTFDLLINCSALTNVDACEDEPERSRRINAEVPVVLARECRRHGAACVHIGTDYVFDGAASEPYTEDDRPAPLSVYGETKLEGEEGVLREDPGALVLRTSRLFSVERPGFPEWVIGKALDSGGEPIPVVGDKFANLTRADGIPVLLDQLLAVPDQAHGIFNLVNSGLASIANQARFILQRARVHRIPVTTTEVRDIPMDSLPAFHAARPRFSGLSNAKFIRVTGKKPVSWNIAVDAHIELIASRYREQAPANR